MPSEVLQVAPADDVDEVVDLGDEILPPEPASIKSPTSVGNGPAGGNVEIGQLQKHSYEWPGDLAKHLEVGSLPDHHDARCIVTKKWVMEAGPSIEKVMDDMGLYKPPLQEEQQEMTEEQKLAEKEKKDAAMKEATEKKAFIDNQRFERIMPVEQSGCNAVPGDALSTFKDSAEPWWTEAILDGEEEVFSFQCGGMVGMPGRTEDELWGTGVLMLTKLHGRHRLHFFQLDECSEFEGHESWTQNSKGDSKKAKADAKYVTEHTSIYTVSNLKVEGNLYHVHATMNDSAKLVSAFEAKFDSPAVSCSCCACCEPCYKSCFSCCTSCLKGCTPCLQCCASCLKCQCCKTECCTKYLCCCCSVDISTESIGSWFSDTYYHVVPEEFTDEIHEEIEEGTEIEFPQIDRMGSVNKKAWRSSAKHYVKIMYWDYLTDSIALCEVLLKKDEPLAKINKFVSYLGDLCEHPSQDKWKTAPGQCDAMELPENHEASAGSGQRRASGGSKSGGGMSLDMSSGKGKGFKKLCKNDMVFCLGKCCCPVCTVFAVDGCSSMQAIFCSCICLQLYTLCCWKPKNRK